MLLHVKKTDVKSGLCPHERLFRVSYCGMQFLLYFEKRFAYSSRREGWACDYYQIGDTIISTGYAPIGESVPHDLIKRYEDHARQIINSYDLKHEEKRQEVNFLLFELIEKMTKGGE